MYIRIYKQRGVSDRRIPRGLPKLKPIPYTSFFRSLSLSLSLSLAVSSLPAPASSRSSLRTSLVHLTSAFFLSLLLFPSSSTLSFLASLARIRVHLVLSSLSLSLSTRMKFTYFALFFSPFFPSSRTSRDT